MDLYILRHGEAEHGPPDALRRLTPAGEREVAAVGRLLARRRRPFDLIVSSHLTRAVQTAEIVARAVGGEAVLRQTPELVSGCGLEEVRRALGDVPEAAAVLLVGHEPSWSRLIQTLCGAQVRMVTGGLARLYVPELAPGAGLLRWLLTPPLLER